MPSLGVKLPRKSPLTYPLPTKGERDRVRGVFLLHGWTERRWQLYETDELTSA